MEHDLPPDSVDKYGRIDSKFLSWLDRVLLKKRRQNSLTAPARFVVRLARENAELLNCKSRSNKRVFKIRNQFQCDFVELAD
jgi:hypothetical protein